MANYIHRIEIQCVDQAEYDKLIARIDVNHSDPPSLPYTIVSRLDNSTDKTIVIEISKTVGV